MDTAAPTYITIPNLVELINAASLLVALIAGGFTLVGAVAVWRSQRNGAWAFFRMFERMQVLQLLTVMLVIASATVLALLGILESNGITGILSGVAGYVLGGLGRGTEKPMPPGTKGQAPGANVSNE